ncbi:AIPR family protein [Streptomyces sp. NPDC059233]
MSRCQNHVRPSAREPAKITSDTKVVRLELFESNVRDCAGSTAVNTAIGDTLGSGTGEGFRWFHNGVTAVADARRISPASKPSSNTPPEIVKVPSVWESYQDRGSIQGAIRSCSSVACA